MMVTNQSFFHRTSVHGWLILRRYKWGEVLCSASVDVSLLIWLIVWDTMLPLPSSSVERILALGWWQIGITVLFLQVLLSLSLSNSFASGLVYHMYYHTISNLLKKPPIIVSETLRFPCIFHHQTGRIRKTFLLLEWWTSLSIFFASDSIYFLQYILLLKYTKLNL